MEQCDGDIKIVIAIFSLLAIVCILSNALVCYIVIKTKALNGVIKYYIFSLAITDILAGAICIPLYLRTKWILCCKQISLYNQLDILKPALYALEIILSTSSIIHLCVMAFDRVMSISMPIYHRMKMRNRSTASKLLAIPWFLATINTAVLMNLRETSIYTSSIIVVEVALCSCFIVSCYSVLVHKIRKRNRSLSNMQPMEQINEKQIIKTMLSVVVAFFICCMPLVAFYIYSIYTYRIPITFEEYQTIMKLYLLFVFMMYLNSACNPFIYAIFNPSFRTAANTTFTSVLRKFKFSSSERSEANADANNIRCMETRW